MRTGRRAGPPAGQARLRQAGSGAKTGLEEASPTAIPGHLPRTGRETCLVQPFPSLGHSPVRPYRERPKGSRKRTASLNGMCGTTVSAPRYAHDPTGYCNPITLASSGHVTRLSILTTNKPSIGSDGMLPLLVHHALSEANAGATNAPHRPRTDCTPLTAGRGMPGNPRTLHHALSAHVATPQPELLRGPVSPPASSRRLPGTRVVPPPEIDAHSQGRMGVARQLVRARFSNDPGRAFRRDCLVSHRSPTGKIVTVFLVWVVADSDTRMDNTSITILDDTPGCRAVRDTNGDDHLQEWTWPGASSLL